MTNARDGEPDAREHTSPYWLLQGARGIFSPPALILTMAYVGFAGVCRDAGLSWFDAAFMTASIWALPASIIVVGAMTAGTSLPAVAFAVALSSLRMMPMTVAFIPEIRGPKTKTSTLLFLSHFVAVTGWVFIMERIDRIPKENRATFFTGFALALTVVDTVLVAVVFNLIGQLPVVAAGALAFLTPVYFLTSMFGSARDTSGRTPLFTGMAALPPAHWLFPGFELLVAGIVGGLVAYAISRVVEARRSKR